MQESNSCSPHRLVGGRICGELRVNGVERVDSGRARDKGGAGVSVLRSASQRAGQVGVSLLQQQRAQA